MLHIVYNFISQYVKSLDFEVTNVRLFIQVCPLENQVKLNDRSKMFNYSFACS